MSDFESKLVKARKLAAMADPANGGTPGEIENARRMLHEHCQRWGITAADFDESLAEWHELDALPPGYQIGRRKPKLYKCLVTLAAQCARHVTGNAKLEVRYGKQDCFYPVRGKLEERRARIYVVTVKVTKAQFEEWRACFFHYAEDLVSTEEELQRRAREAQRAVRIAAQAFVHRHKIYAPEPDDARPARPMDPAKLGALLSAMDAVQGEAWERKAGHFEQGGFFLEAS